MVPGGGGGPRCGRRSTALGGCSLGHSPQAKTSGKFSREELDKLWREFQHHREKVREYSVLLEALSRAEGVPSPRPSLRAALAPERSRGGGPHAGSSHTHLVSEWESRCLGTHPGAFDSCRDMSVR